MIKVRMAVCSRHCYVVHPKWKEAAHRFDEEVAHDSEKAPTWGLLDGVELQA